jgi:putative ABC transport system substrate-binding protein
MNWKPLAVVVGLTASVLAAVSLNAQRVYRIGIITFAGEPMGGDGAGPPMPIKDLLAQRGYVEGRNVVYRYRASGRNEELSDRQAKELVDWKPDLVIAQMTNADIAMKKATEGTNIPVVFWSTDGIAAGVVKSWAKSGTNFTGFSYEPTWALQQIRVLKLVVPGLKKAGHLYNHTYAPAANVLRDLKAEGALLGVEITVHETLRKEEFEPAIAAMKAEGAGGILVGPHELFNTNGSTLGQLSIKYGLPMVGCCQVSIARGGGFASYSPPNGWPAMAERIDLILQGKVKPDDLPVLRSFASPLTLNLKTAAALGLTVPESLIQEAQQVIR